MLEKYIKDIVDDQKKYYLLRPEIVYLLPDKDIRHIEETNNINKREFTLIRRKVLGLEGDEANASYDEGYLK